MLLLWCFSMTQACSLSSWWNTFFISSLISSKQLFSLVAEAHLTILRCCHKPTTSLFFSLLVFQQLRSNLLGRMLSKFNCGRSCHFLLRSFVPTFYLLFFRYGGIVILLFSLIISFCQDQVLFLAYPFNRSVVFS